VLKVPVSYKAKINCASLIDFGEEHETDNTRGTGSERTTASSDERKTPFSLHSEGNEGSGRKDNTAEQKPEAEGTYDWTDSDGYSFF